MSQPDLFTPSVFSVSELTDDIKSLLEGNFIDIKVEGEISNASTSANGHTYFTLKDEDAQLSCVIWRSTSRRIGGDPVVDGQQIIARGDIQVYPPHGKYQLIVQSVEQAGVGALQEAFEKLKAKLKEEGLFDEKHKKPLPEFPRRIGVITSETGAAFHDITNTLERRWPVAEVHLHHASVQGVNAAPELVKAINWFSEDQDVDVLIVGRGGGSLEDLWPFNEEAVARALFNCKVPTISAVGHEVDFSISDFVADARAATPTQAAIVATPDINEYRMLVDDLGSKLEESVSGQIDQQKEQVEQLVSSHALLAIEEKVINNHEKVNNLTQRLDHRSQMLFMKKREELTDLTYRLESKNPNLPLERGFARVWQEGKWIKQASNFDIEQGAELEWEDGKLDVGS
ncbi:exodeoxyribonuclease VII large subunit [Aliifodinibius sp. S!AR15-10]|uniref:exodeoxyribonuclease VII large subunit n=1 Tax=Aliifodinibius sp. S!AR15-10 TaxID=2950437 RepID=UPI0028667AEC|nr:exodeoxyribonuclease VII large subunit [Aliifodinibius sp. S!AR15-10]MDR8389747.1 exodeoxyribonuclease VII large subunit [Aliifodinibius sp. S!AR15-10]